mmetsp:Transcript_3175/g.6076  ORF Transcript_3175/g.6076 Transcript_3175/m.6076 type:complete len:370 (-) Transcript_3175:191-1300(-)|eukprot:CAMPEP_0201624678 /NCGR_PEP_ID=MMETSP0493-20130528/772_1 /ASSEMBLY_ACC=CAM_ASM_000838 /TAXON_ID=420259 /ORGANISM="Thalassiosira gravida, Strain GMp14c1" /LENGTH=369 /DNA_ID=CAMNT_0048094549 /DNA_START=217 /DNA_END=1326 /DNA_ORIENTATION=-
MSAPAPGMSYGYQMPPTFSYPPQPMMPFPMPMPGGGGTVPMMAPPQPQPYAMPRGVAPPPTKAATQVCTVHPDGMPQPFDVPFPEKRLPVCDRCKKNYRSRELCRQRDGHKALPWQMTYVVVTLTDEVLIKGEDGALILADVPVVAELQDMPELCRGPADGSMKMEPICPVCKEKNYTRDHCRNTLKHSTPPYQSIYVKLVLKQEDDNNLRPSKKKKRKPEENADGKPRCPDEAVGDDHDKTDDITVIHESKTFFATISSKRITVKWCEQIRYADASTKPIHPPSSGSYMMPPAAPNNPNMQYQLWDAFRAGAQWVQSGGGHMPGGPMVQMGGGYPMPPSYGHDPKPPSNGPDMKYASNLGGSLTNASV